MTNSPDPGAWRTEHADKAAVIVDAQEYYRRARRAMMNAREQLMLIGWDFDTRIWLDPSKPDDGAPWKLGPFISWLADNRPDLQINILTWGVGAAKLVGRGTTLFRLAKWASSPQITFQVDKNHPTGASHHQKIVVIDDSLAFCGGIDMTAARWDTREHRDRDDRRRRPFTRRRYMPWHDATMALEGDVAKALGELARDRWKLASGVTLPVPHAHDGVWIDGFEPHFTDVPVTIARTRGETDTLPQIREIEAQFVAMIRDARRFAYIETQYFASRAIAEAIAARLDEADGPEFVLVNPKVADGWLEEFVMGAARAALIEELGKRKHSERLRIFTPVTTHGADIYVHAKIMIVDDAVLRVGSANMNNRSMGLDSECDVTIEARPASDHDGAARATIAAIRTDLMAEHLGVDPEAVEQHYAKTGSLIATIDALRGSGRTLVPFVPPDITEFETAVADSQSLDPEHPEQAFEPAAKRRLLRRLKRTRRRR
ncbi:phospholipase D-like domain-containing protein [Sphingomonas japonica]|uniref:Phospholipase D n=1 Tax=Sphingomonas japonica TaxID=511662 RepID=A0ABX0U156_9SPHN|nr:phospholipase D1/2 [Sphingomonas japonica]